MKVLLFLLTVHFVASFCEAQLLLPGIMPSVESDSHILDQQRIQLQNQQIIEEVDRDIQIWLNEERKKVEMQRITTLPSFSHLGGTQFYYDAFDLLNSLDSANYSITDVVFLIENTFYGNQLDFQKLKNKIVLTGQLLKEKIDEIDSDSNTAKNMLLFQYFTENMKLGNENHKPFKYDFDDFWGAKDHSKMFVSKLMNSGTGQCHSMPLLYLMLAEQIGAEAYLSLSPNHSYIRFPDDLGDMQNIELTNGMFTTNTYILESGYIKSEALQNKIYMQNLDKQQLLSQMYTDLAGGYIHKYGYDEFTGEVLNKSLELYPNNINSQMLQANYLRNKFEYATKELNIDSHNSEDLQNIGHYPEVVGLLNQFNSQNQQIENLGYLQMPAEEYIKWLNSVNKEQNKQNSETIKKTLKPTQKKTNKIKHEPKKKEEVKQKIFH